MSALAPLLGDKQTSGERVPNDAIDPSLQFDELFCRDAQRDKPNNNALTLKCEKSVVLWRERSLPDRTAVGF